LLYEKILLNRSSLFAKVDDQRSFNKAI